MKVAIVGAGSRHKMYREAVIADFSANHELVALCDGNVHRLNQSAQAAHVEGTNGVATYEPAQFAQLLTEQKPDTIVVTTPDFLHHEYIVKAFEAGCNVICEKPMTIDLDKLKKIVDARDKSGKSVTVTFNYRYSPARTQIKDILMKGTIGEITAVDFRWYLDRVHGADYFRRWHRQKEFSGGLLVHKATHHFDLLNWWVGATPKQVLATGSRKFYLPGTARDLGLAEHGERCADCGVAQKCDFQLDFDGEEELQSLYRDAEHLDGYFRDRCVFSDEIGIEDTMQAHIRFDNGVNANYSLVAYSPWEGLEVKFQGTKGELTHRHVEVHGVFGGKREHAADDAVTTTLHLAGQAEENLDVWAGKGTHGGADPVMLGHIFDKENVAEDIYGRSSDHVMGGWSILTGIAANKSIETGNLVDIDTMLKAHEINLPRPTTI